MNMLEYAEIITMPFRKTYVLQLSLIWWKNPVILWTVSSAELDIMAKTALKTKVVYIKKKILQTGTEAGTLRF